MSFIQIFKNSTLYEILLVISSCIFIVLFAYPMTALPFWYQEPKFYCKNEQGLFFQCSQTIACSNEYKDTFMLKENSLHKSLVLEYKLYCDRKGMITSGQSLNMAGILLMSVVFCFLKINNQQQFKVLQLGFLASGVISLICAFSDNAMLIIFMTSLIFFANQIFNLNIYSYLNSQVNPKLSELAVSILTIIYYLSIPFYCVFDYYVKNWRVGMIFYYAVPSLLNVVFFTLVLKFKQQLHKPVSTQQVDIEMNNTVQLKQKLMETYDKNNTQVKQTTPEQQQSCLSIAQIFQDSEIRKIAIVLCVYYTVCNTSFLGTQFCASDLPGNIYFNMSLSGVLSMMGALITTYLLFVSNTFSIIKTFTVLTSIDFIIFLFKEEGSTNQAFILFFLLGRTLINMNWQVMYVLMGKIAPLNSQKTILSLSVTFGYFVAILLPYFNNFLISMSINPISIMSFLNLLIILMLQLIKQNETTKQQSVQLQEENASQMIALIDLNKEFSIQEQPQKNNVKFTSLKVIHQNNSNIQENPQLIQLNNVKSNMKNLHLNVKLQSPSLKIIRIDSKIQTPLSKNQSPMKFNYNQNNFSIQSPGKVLNTIQQQMIKV